MANLTERQLELLRGRNFAAIATLGPSGGPQTSVVWIDTDGEAVIFNTTNARAKGRNLERDPRISLVVWDKENPYRYFEVEGRAELVRDGAEEKIHELSRKYRDVDFDGPMDRVTVRVVPERIFAYQVDD